MATTIKLKNSVTTTAAPSTLVQGEAAVNITDKKVWVGDASSSPVQIVGAGAPVSGTTGTFTGNVSVAGTFSANGGATLGDASGDALTINSSAVSIPNGLNFDSNTLVIDATNNYVGIGIATPSSPLSFASVTGQKIRFYNSLSGYGIGVESSEFRFVTDSSSKFTWLNGTYSGGTTYMTLDANGRLLIGNTTNNTSFGGLLQVEGTDKAFANIVRYSSNAAGAPAFYLARSKSATLGTNTIVASGDTLGTILFAGANGTTYSDAAYIQAAVDGTPGASADMPGRLMFFTSADGSATPTERMRIDSSGNVGIGTSSPSSYANYTTVTQNGTNGVEYDFKIGGTLAGYFEVTSTLFKFDAESTRYFQWVSNGSEKMRLDSSGNLGLGVTPSAWSLLTGLQIKYANFAGYSNNAYMSANAYFNGSAWNYQASSYANAYMQQSGQHQWYNAPSGTAGNTITFTQAMTLDASGNLGLGSTTTSGGRLVISQSNGVQPAIYLPTDESTIQGPNANTQIRMGGNLTVKGNGVTSIEAASVSGYVTMATAGSERMRIDSSGNLLVGTTSRAFSEKLALSYDGVSQQGAYFTDTSAAGTATAIGFKKNGSAVGGITCTSTATAYNTSSDIRLKNDLGVATESVIDKVVIHDFTWKADGTKDKGVFAQELYEIKPSAVAKGQTEEDVWGVDYSKLVPDLIIAVQKLQAKVTALEAQLNK